MDCHTGSVASAEISFFNAGSMEFYPVPSGIRSILTSSLSRGRWIKSWRRWAEACHRLGAWQCSGDRLRFRCYPITPGQAVIHEQ
jgi:hypothetical protein